MNEPRKNSVVFVLFGATGDLALKKIFPALDALAAEGALGPEPRIVAVGRRDWDDGDFISFLKESAPEAGFRMDFLGCISYAKVDIEAETGYGALAKTIKKLQGGRNKKEVVYYTSLAPAFHGKAAKGLGDAGLLYRASDSDTDVAAPKLLIEKPFGTDEKTACALDRLLSSIVDESQIYRVDHYLGKDTIRAIMDLHENTPDFSDLLSAGSVESIRVRLFEEKGIDGRGATYDVVGAFRDVGQNHLLETLSVLVADIPRSGTKKGSSGVLDRGDVWQSARAAPLKRLDPPIKTCELSRRGQYTGYQQEKGVRPGSEVETAFEVVTSFRSGKLKGVPLIIESGKKMLVSEALVEVLFKDVSGLPKKMIFKIQPEQEISIENRDGSVEGFEIPRTRDAYGNVIAAALQGSRRGFVGSAEIEALWSYADHVVACWSKVPLESYGPDKPFLVS